MGDNSTGNNASIISPALVGERERAPDLEQALPTVIATAMKPVASTSVSTSSAPPSTNEQSNKEALLKTRMRSNSNINSAANEVSSLDVNSSAPIATAAATHPAILAPGPTPSNASSSDVPVIANDMQQPSSACSPQPSPQPIRGENAGNGVATPSEELASIHYDSRRRNESRDAPEASGKASIPALAEVRGGSWFGFGKSSKASKATSEPQDQSASPMSTETEKAPQPITPLTSGNAASAKSEGCTKYPSSSDPDATQATAILTPKKPQTLEVESASSPRSRGWFGSISKGKGPMPEPREKNEKSTEAKPQSAVATDDAVGSTLAVSQEGNYTDSNRLSPQPQQRPTIKERASTAPSSIDNEVPPHPESSPIVIPSPELVSTQTTDMKLSALNPATSRFALGLPILGRSKAPIEQSAKNADGEAPSDSIERTVPDSQCDMSRQLNVLIVC
jgi:hypothetical protein